MKTWLPLALVLVSIGGQALAADYRLQVTAEKKRFGVDRAKSISTQTSNEKWGYAVQIKNVSFKDLPNASVEYLVFSREESMGTNSAGTNKRFKGTKPIGNLKNNDVFKFETEPVEITKSQLIGGWYYANGAKPQSKDAVTGIWMRVMSDGNLAFEYFEPANLNTKETWDKAEKQTKAAK